MRKLYLVLLIMTMISLSSCGVTKKTLGFTREGPDETAVRTNKPLVLPPEYNVRPKQVKTDETLDYTAVEND